MKNLLLISLLIFGKVNFAQIKSGADSYTDSIHRYLKNYVNTHEVVKGEDRKYLQFFTPDKTYKVLAVFQKIHDVLGFEIPTSGKIKQSYYRYGKITFKIKDSTCQLFVYQSKDLMITKDYANYLFIPFRDATNGYETYEGGRYIDITIEDIKKAKLTIDFNKAYNPYCSYVAGYSCPVPPQENALKISINAGEKKYLKPIH